MQLTTATAGELRIVWQRNTETDLAGYVLYYGTRSGVYTNRVPLGLQTKYLLSGLEPGQTYFIAITAVDTAGNESVYSDEVAARVSTTNSENSSRLPRQHELRQNHPNPFYIPRNRTTKITFELFEESPVQLEIFDVLGQRIITLVDKTLEVGTHQFSWNGRNAKGQPARAGVYTYRLQTSRQTTTRKLVVYR
jgi:hypothetical protein